MTKRIFPRHVYIYILHTSTILVQVEELKTNLMPLVVFISLIFAQHVSDINMSIFRSLRLWWWLTTSVILFSFLCVLGFAAGDAWWYPFCRL